MPEPLTAEERARAFVLKYPLMFKEDKDWWIATFGLEILEAEKAQLEADKKMMLKIIGPVKS